MKKIIIIFLFVCSFIVSYGQNRSKATISKSDSIIYMNADIRRDHRIFGYTQPDTTSKKMILFSVFTNEVEGNPFDCPYGSYYETSNMRDMKIKYLSRDKDFVKASIIKKDAPPETICILKKWIEFEK